MPDLADYKPSGKPEPPLGKATDWVVRDAQRQALSPRDEHHAAVGRLVLVLPALSSTRTTTSAFCDPEKAKHWLPVDLYVGGAEHAVLHLLYSRFWHKVLFDRGHVPTPEPFQQLVNQGMILGEIDYHVTPEVYDQHKAAIGRWALRVLTLKQEDREIVILRNPSDDPEKFSPLTEEQVEKKGETFSEGDRRSN